MRFTWDPEKRQTNLEKHGVDFADAETVFRGVILTFEDARRNYGEQRWIALGMLRGTVVAMAFTEPREDQIRLLSMRRATRNEQKLYYGRLPD